MHEGLQAVLDSREVLVFFQPVVSVEQRSIIGFEAYTRGGSHGPDMVKPDVLFDDTLDLDVQLEIDRICRENILKHFQDIAKNHPDVLLFLNINAKALTSRKLKPELLHDQVHRSGLSPQRVVLELPQRQLTPELPWILAELYQKHGYRFSIDDGSISPVTQEAMIRLKPDYLKLARPGLSVTQDRSLRIKLLEALREATERSGCRVVGKGVESEDEAFLLLDAGVVLQQGFFFTKSADDSGDTLDIFRRKIVELHHRYRERQTAGIQAKREAFQTINRMAAKLCYKFSRTQPEDFPALVRAVLRTQDTIYAVFVVDGNGQEVARAAGESGSGTSCSGDHSFRDYFLHLKTGFEKYCTTPFVSPHTKQRHFILAQRFFGRDDREYILGLELRYPGD